MVTNYKSMMAVLIEKGDWYNQWNQKTGWVTEKKGLVARKSEFAPQWINGNFVIRGKLYSVLPQAILPLRTLFFKKPIKIENNPFYLEVKGYGFNGRELYFQEHVSGDIFYGMYLESALREFERMGLALSLGLPVPLPLAVIEIPRAEYIKKGMLGFQRCLEAGLHIALKDKIEKIDKIVGGIDDFHPKAIAQQLVKFIERNYKEDVVEGIKFLVQELGGSSRWGYGIDDATEALLSGKKVGYLIRASRCPIRIGDPSDKNIDTPEFREIAISIGYAFKTLLEKGILHHCPGTGNWTIAGELTDFTDTFDLAGEEEKLKAHIKKLKQERRIERGDLKSFLRYLIGPRHSGLLSPYFLKGMFGHPISLEEATRRLLKIF